MTTRSPLCLKCHRRPGEDNAVTQLAQRHMHLYRWVSSEFDRRLQCRDVVTVLPPSTLSRDTWCFLNFNCRQCQPPGCTWQKKHRFALSSTRPPDALSILFLCWLLVYLLTWVSRVQRGLMMLQSNSAIDSVRPIPLPDVYFGVYRNPLAQLDARIFSHHPSRPPCSFTGPRSGSWHHMSACSY